ncbi:MAG: hypothetical protein FJ146_18665 [Deltaproteobacteria bacterium]|nr:hypothetical protein [Deltaproteobacteria bacterium]
MNTKLAALLTTAITSGLISAQAAKAADGNASGKTAQESGDKNGCESKDKNSCHGKDMKKKKSAKSDKNSCKNGCGEAKDSSDATGK